MTRTSLPWVINLLFHLYLCGGGWALRGVRLWVPEAVRAGSHVKLLCDYDLEQAALYSIKWYRGEEEFYRYVPKESPPTRVFALPGVHVDVSLSDAREVTLLDVSPRLTGSYKCEVSADAPLFHTAIKSAYMTVVDVPSEGPSLSVDKQRFSAGDLIRANCTSQPSYPAANLTWLVNNKPVPSSGPTIVSVEPGSVLEVSRSRLSLEAGSYSFPDPMLRVRCVATLFNVYRRSSEMVELLEDTPQIASVLGASRSGASDPRTSAILVVAFVLAVASR